MQPVNLEKWTVPGIFAGNELPGWVDNAGSIVRRILLFQFDQLVTEKDTNLDTKLHIELPHILVKSNRAYLATVSSARGADVWKIVPQYFREQRMLVASACNPLEAFITSGKVVREAGKYVPWKHFVTALHQHLDENDLKRVELKPDTYVPIFSRNGLKKCALSKRPYDGAVVHDNWVEGCTLVDMRDDVGVL